jgi:hypothetical protein
MNKEELDALRNKHREASWHVGDTVQESWCIGCAPEAIPAYPEDYPYPCDAIKALDECDHDNARYDDEWLSKYDYCPECGEKL